MKQKQFTASSTFRLVYWTKILFCPTKMVSWWGICPFMRKKLFAALQLWAKVGWEVCISQHHQEAKKGKMW